MAMEVYRLDVLFGPDCGNVPQDSEETAKNMMAPGHSANSSRLNSDDLIRRGKMWGRNVFHSIRLVSGHFR
jgi:hypothetical protein